MQSCYCSSASCRPEFYLQAAQGAWSGAPDPTVHLQGQEGLQAALPCGLPTPHSLHVCAARAHPCTHMCIHAHTYAGAHCKRSGHLWGAQGARAHAHAHARTASQPHRQTGTRDPVGYAQPAEQSPSAAATAAPDSQDPHAGPAPGEGAALGFHRRPVTRRTHAPKDAGPAIAHTHNSRYAPLAPTGVPESTTRGRGRPLILCPKGQSGLPWPPLG